MAMNLCHIASIAAGGAIGAISRYVIKYAITMSTASTFPFGTLTVNLFGSFVAGILFGLSDFFAFSTTTKLFIFTGILGAFTTFASFAFENFNLFKTGKISWALTNIIVSNVCGILLFGIGLLITKQLINK